MKHRIIKSLFAAIFFLAPPPSIFALPNQTAHSLEAYGSHVYLISPKGLFISKNQGASWRHENINLQGILAYKNILFGKTDNKILLSKNHGKSWNTIYSSTVPISSLAIENHQLYIGCSDGIYTSSNGKRWDKIDTPPIIPAARFIAAEGENLYIGSDYIQPNLSLWIRRNGNWQRILVDHPPRGLYVYNNTLYVLSNNTLLIQDGDLGNWRTVDIPANAIFGLKNTIYLAADDGLHVSHDAGLTWNIIFTSTKPLVEVVASKKNIYVKDRDGYLFASTNLGKTWRNLDYALEIRSLALTSHKTLFAATNNGIRLYDTQKHRWQTAAFANQVIPLITANKYPSLSNQIYAADLQKLWISNDSGQTWKLLRDFTDDQDYILSLYVDNQLIVVGAEGSIFISQDGGITWNKAVSNIYAANAIFGDDNTIIIGLQNKILISKDRGDTWTTINFELEPHFILSIYADNNMLYAGGSSDGIIISNNFGKTWKTLAATKTWKDVTAIFKSKDKRTLYAVHDGFLAKSKDEGITWASKSPDNLTVESALIDGNNYYIGTAYSGLYFSYDRGINWLHII